MLLITREQPAAARQDGLRQLLLLGVEPRRHQQLRQADHAAHRRADLVAHVGEELALGAGGALGPRGRLGERRGALADARLEAGQRLAQRGVRRLAIGHRLPQVAVALAEARDHRLEIALQRLHLDGGPGVDRPRRGEQAARADLARLLDQLLDRPGHAARRQAGERDGDDQAAQHPRGGDARRSASPGDRRAPPSGGRTRASRRTTCRSVRSGSGRRRAPRRPLTRYSPTPEPRVDCTHVVPPTWARMPGRAEAGRADHHAAIVDDHQRRAARIDQVAGDPPDPRQVQRPLDDALARARRRHDRPR